MANMRPIRQAFKSAFSLAVLALGAGSARGEELALPPQPIITLPVTLENNRPTTTLEVNGQPLSLLLDTGASKSLILEGANLRSGSLKTDDQVDIRFPAFNQMVLGSMLESVEFRAGDFVFTSHGTLLLHGDNDLTQRLATKMDGILGRDFFRNYAVAISASAHKLVLYPAGTDLSELYKTVQPLSIRNGSPYMIHRSRLPWENVATVKVFMLDTGYPGGVALWDEDHFERATRRSEAATLRAERKGILYFGHFRFGRLLFNNLPVFIGSHTPKQLQDREGIIGATILAPFDYAIDLTAAKLWLTPNMSGLYSGFELSNKEIYTPGDEEFVVKDFRPPISATPKVVIYGSGPTPGQPR